MISGFPSIVVIDDKEEELNSVKTALFESGIPCLPIQYINDDPDNESGIDHIDLSEWTSPRIVISDLNLTEVQNAKPTNLAGPIAKMLQKLSLKGPYLLCVWSKLPQQVSDVMQILETRHNDTFTLPLQVSVISKNEFLNEPDDLKEKLRNLISENSLFDTLLNWEAKVSKAARDVMTNLYSLSQKNSENKPTTDRAVELQKILAVIGNEALGKKNAADSPASAIEYGLTPILEDHIRLISETDLDKKWEAAVPQIGTNQKIEDSIKARLNAFYHIEEVAENYSKTCRGIFVSLNKEYLAENQKIKKFERRLGRSVEELIHDEFLRRKRGADGKALAEKARNETILGFLEISAACDYAQRKTKFPRYVLGALIPNDFEELATFRTSQGLTKDRAHDGVYRLPKILIGNKVYIVKFSFKYQLGAQPNDNQWFGDSIFRVKDQILSTITFNCSQYASRPGTVSFL